MGTSESKDERVEVYYELSKPFYYAGEYIEGTVYLNIKADTEYSALYIKFTGMESCRWSEGSSKHRRHYSGSLKTFENEFIIANFEPGLRFGQYSFPFSMRTSSEFSGSFSEVNMRNGKIAYTLQAYLADYTSKNPPQSYCYNVTILEPPRVVPGMVLIKKEVNPQVCCCMAQG